MNDISTQHSATSPRSTGSDLTGHRVRLVTGKEAVVVGRVSELCASGRLGRSMQQLPGSAWYVKVCDSGAWHGHVVTEDEITVRLS